MKTLEIGTGTSRFAKALRIALGLEPARSMVRFAKQRGLEVVIGVAEFLSFKRERFDLIVIAIAFSFYKIQIWLLKETLRILKLGRQLIIGIL